MKHTKEQLYNLPRMFYQELIPFNSVRGLQELIDDCVTADTIMVEIGSFAGVSSELFAQHCKLLHCVDIWHFYPEYPNIEHDILEKAFDMFGDMFSEYNNIVYHTCTSEEAKHTFEHNKWIVDLVYIDSQHSYEDVKKDIQLWMPKIKSGGWITGHDWSFEGVAKAVKEFSNDIKIYPDDSWAFKKL